MKLNLNKFNTANLFEAATDLFEQLNIKLNSNTSKPIPIRDILNYEYKNNDTFSAIQNAYFIGTIDDSVFNSTGKIDVFHSYKEALNKGDKNYNGLILFALDLSKYPTRNDISEITRAFNRISQKMPVALVLRYSSISSSEEKGFLISIAISERFKYLQNWRQGEKAGKVIILRDINTQNTHAGHIRILQDLIKPVGVNTFEQLHQYWLQVLDVGILTKKFFQELSNWYFAAINEVSFPDDLEKNKEIRNAINVIRLITRVIFIWFIKEKKLVPDFLFRKDFVAGILKDFNRDKKSHNYYNAILQNLFFGTLNQMMEERKFVKEGNFRTNMEEYGVKNLFRYPDLFAIPEKKVLELFKDIPFLNGGLFDCLDKLNDNGKVIYVDGFSRNPKKRAIVPDYLFFGDEWEVDLNNVYDTRNKNYKTRGLINLLDSYKFTVAENTPIEEEIALDPELLGKVFENLLANYNPETKTTARKQTGSFYTPREIVNYMVDESLIEYLKQNTLIKADNFDSRLRNLFSYNEEGNPFDENETKKLINAIYNCKILDPACGSGAFPMGVLQKMVHILRKLDPDNSYSKELIRKKVIEETKGASSNDNNKERNKVFAEIIDAFQKIDGDYGRKLYLIQNCIYGIDIQPIAVQIAKLRFFISLIVNQKVSPLSQREKNLGIRPLPNLENNILAANILIGMNNSNTLLANTEIINLYLNGQNKPNSSITNCKSDEIYELVNKLKEVRHKYFFAKTRKEKLYLQQKDKELRKKFYEKYIENFKIDIPKKIKELKDQLADLKNELELKLKENEPKQQKTYEEKNLFGGTETKVFDKNKEKINKLKKIIKSIQNDIKSLNSTDYKKDIKIIFKHISSFDPYDQNHFANWFDPEWMFGIKVTESSGFDIIIGNPPYIQLQKDGGKLAKEYENHGFETYERTGDIYTLFYEKGMQLLKNKGHLCYVTSNKWMRAGYGKSTRAFFLKHNPVKLIDLGSGVFESATVDTNILLIQKTENQHQLLAADLSKANNLADLQNAPYVTLRNLTADSWTISSDIEQRIKAKIEAKGKPLKDWDIQINYGIKTGYNEAFIIDGKKRDELIAQDPRSAEIIKPLLRGRDIKRYKAEWQDLWLINSHNGVKELGIPRIDVPKDYPAIYQHLLHFEDKLKKRLDKGDHWTNLRNCAYIQEFEKEKIVWAEMTNENAFVWDSNGILINQTCYFILNASKYLLGILNSKLIYHYFSFISASLGEGAFRWIKQYVEKLPLPAVAEPQQHLIIQLVEQILVKKERGEDTAVLEQQIDNLVYRLYDLTYEEVKVIDPEFPLSREEYEAISVG